MKNFQSILDAIKLNPKYLFGIMVFTGILIFIGNGGYLSEFGFDEALYEKFKVWISLAFFLAASMFIAHVVFFLIEFFKTKYREKSIIKMRKKRLHVLTMREKEILSYYIDNNETSQLLKYTDGHVRELENYKVIYRASELSQRFDLFPYNIQTWAKEYLIKKRHLLK